MDLFLKVSNTQSNIKHQILNTDHENLSYGSS